MANSCQNNFNQIQIFGSEIKKKKKKTLKVLKVVLFFGYLVKVLKSIEDCWLIFISLYKFVLDS